MSFIKNSIFGINRDPWATWDSIRNSCEVSKFSLQEHLKEFFSRYGHGLFLMSKLIKCVTENFSTEDELTEVRNWHQLPNPGMSPPEAPVVSEFLNLLWISEFFGFQWQNLSEILSLFLGAILGNFWPILGHLGPFRVTFWPSWVGCFTKTLFQIKK